MTGSKFPEALDTASDLPDIDQAAKENDAGKEHDVMHLRLHQAVRALEHKVGIDNSQDTTSIDYRLAQVEENGGGGGGGGSGLVIGADDAESWRYDENKTIPPNPSKWLVATINGVGYLVPGFEMKKRVVIFDTPGSFTYIPSVGVTRVRVLIVGGGGAGGCGDGGGYWFAGGGGGAGGVIEVELDISSASHSVIVGAGGIGTDYTQPANSGQPSSAFGLIAPGGGGGGGGIYSNDELNAGRSGASGGGGGGGRGGGSAGGDSMSDGTFLGSGGGAGNANYSYAGGGGGGGAGGEGADAAANSPGSGGAGFSSNITGVMRFYGAGGGGAGGIGPGGVGGSGIGGNGGGDEGSSAPSNGLDGTGSGGGGDASRSTIVGKGGNGGCGCVIIAEL